MTPGNQAANYVQQFWTVPAVTWVQQGNSNSESLAVWGGIGGWHTVPGLLIQDGTESDVVCNGATGVNCSSISTYYSFWIEYYPGESEQVITNLVPSPGDSVATDVSWAGSTAHFELCDYTKNSCVSGSQTIPSTPGKMAEWIVERPQYDLPTGTTWLALPKFNPITISSAEYEIGSSWYTPQTGGADWVDMYSVGGADQLDNTQALFNDTFTVNWLAAW